MYGVGWFSAYLICINLINFSSLIHIESMLAPLGWVVSVVCPPGVFLRMFEIPLDNFVSSRDKNFPVGNFCSRVASQIIYTAKKNNRPIFSLDKSTQEILLNPLNPKSDWHQTSLYNIIPESHVKVRRIKEMITNERSF